MKTFFRVANIATEQGLWYDQNGVFTGLIHETFNFCQNTDLKMPFDPEVVGYLSATETLEELYRWFPIEDIVRLECHGYRIMIYEATDYKYYKNHWLISQETSNMLGYVQVQLPQVA